MQDINPFPEHGENPLLDAQLKEALEVKAFLDSPAWTWMKARLERLRPALMAKSALVGGERPLTTDERMIVLGKLALVEELLARPGMLTALLSRKDAAELAIPEAAEILNAAPQRYSPGRL
jgi:hypothetical protein